MKLSELAPGRNPRKIGQAEQARLRHSLLEFGLVDRLVFNQRSGKLVAGHQRLKILQEAGVTETDVVVVDLPPDKEAALNLALNNPHAQGEFTAEVNAILEALQSVDHLTIETSHS
jgi:ParB-like chromosome segregation protein Spo0J